MKCLHKSSRLLLVSLGLWWLSSHPVFADVTGTWQLSGSLQINVQLKGKTYRYKPINLNSVKAVFNADRSCEILAGDQSISGNWIAVKRNFKTQLSAVPVNALLKSIEKDLAAKSGLQVLIEDAQSQVLSGVERKNATIKGSLKIKAGTLFLDYGYKKGKLNISYDFTGTRIKSDEIQMLIRPE